MQKWIEEQEKRLRDFVSGGKKWFALHGTNAILEFVANGVDTPRIAKTKRPPSCGGRTTSS